MGQMLLDHLSPENAARQGLTIQGEAVINNAHTLYMIVDGHDRAQVERFMAPFAQAGSVEVLDASSCAAVVDRGGCAMVLP